MLLPLSFICAECLVDPVRPAQVIALSSALPWDTLRNSPSRAICRRRAFVAAPPRGDYNGKATCKGVSRWHRMAMY